MNFCKICLLMLVVNTFVGCIPERKDQAFGAFELRYKYDDGRQYCICVVDFKHEDVISIKHPHAANYVEVVAKKLRLEPSQNSDWSFNNFVADAAPIYVATLQEKLLMLSLVTLKNGKRKYMFQSQSIFFSERIGKNTNLLFLVVDNDGDGRIDGIFTRYNFDGLIGPEDSHKANQLGIGLNLQNDGSWDQLYFEDENKSVRVR